MDLAYHGLVALALGAERLSRYYLRGSAARGLGDLNSSIDSDIQVLETDQGQYMGFIRMVAKRR